MYYDKISFSTTATNRPAILKKTYKSFMKGLINFDLKQATLYINVDPAPNDINIANNVSMAKKFFGKVIPNIPKKPNFSASINWLWSQATTDLLFHLEDDWVLSRKVDIGPLVDKLLSTPKLMQIPLRAYSHMVYNKFCLSPSLIKREIYSHVGGKLRTDMNPEIQLRSPRIIGTDTYKGMVVAYERKRGSKPIVRDIGRLWAENENIHRPKIKRDFVTWMPKKRR